MAPPAKVETGGRRKPRLLRAKPGMRIQEVKFNWAEAYDTGYLPGVAVTRIENFLTHSAK